MTGDLIHRKCQKNIPMRIYFCENGEKGTGGDLFH